jgi:hypothetical protein
VTFGIVVIASEIVSETVEFVETVEIAETVREHNPCPSNCLDYIGPF